MNKRADYNRKLRQRRSELGLCRGCGREREEGYLQCNSCRVLGTHDIQYQKDWKRKLKLEVLAAYGGVCQCCGETDSRFLTIDHVNRDGGIHRKEMRMQSGTQIYSWLKQNDFPKEGFQILCFNCNLGREINGGICPHQEAKIKLAPLMNVSVVTDIS